MIRYIQNKAVICLAVMLLFLGTVHPNSLEARQTVAQDLVYEVTIGELADVQALLARKVDPNSVDENGWPVLSLAAVRADDQALPIAKALVEAGADLNKEDPNGDTPLMKAISSNNVMLVHYLITKGGDFYAINKKGRNVKDFADWIGNEKIIGLIDEAIRLDQERIRISKSKQRMYRLLDEYIYYNCALQYVSFYVQSKQDPVDEKDFALRLEKMQSLISKIHVELQYTFKMPAAQLNNIGEKTRAMVFKQLDELISNRYRRQKGVGKAEDMEKRCRTILEGWREGFADFEEKRVK